MYLYSCLNYPTCKAYGFSTVLYCHLWSDRLYHIIPHYHVKTARFHEKDFEYIRGVLIFSKTSSETFPILRRNQRDIKNVQRSSYKVPVTVVIFEWNLNFFGQIFEKSASIKFYAKPSVVAELFHADRQVDWLT